MCNKQGIMRKKKNLRAAKNHSLEDTDSSDRNKYAPKTDWGELESEDLMELPTVQRKKSKLNMGKDLCKILLYQFNLQDFT